MKKKHFIPGKITGYHFTEASLYSTNQPMSVAMEHHDVPQKKLQKEATQLQSVPSLPMSPAVSAEVHPLGAAAVQPLVLSSNYPIAPDCKFLWELCTFGVYNSFASGFIPNSVIRAKTGRHDTGIFNTQDQESRFFPAFNETTSKRIWKRKSLHHFKPVLKIIPPLESLSTVAIEPSKPLQPTSPPCLLEEEVLLNTEDEEDDLMPPEQAVRFVFSESWQAARACLLDDIHPSQIQAVETEIGQRSNATAKDDLQEVSESAPHSLHTSSHDLPLHNKNSAVSIAKQQIEGSLVNSCLELPLHRKNSTNICADSHLELHLPTAKYDDKFETLCKWQRFLHLCFSIVFMSQC